MFIITRLKTTKYLCLTLSQAFGITLVTGSTSYKRHITAT